MKPKTAKKFKNSRFGKNNPNYGNYKLKESETEIINLHSSGIKRDKLGRFKKYV